MTQWYAPNIPVRVPGNSYSFEETEYTVRDNLPRMQALDEWMTVARKQSPPHFLDFWRMFKNEVRWEHYTQGVQKVVASVVARGWGMMNVTLSVEPRARRYS